MIWYELLAVETICGDAAVVSVVYVAGDDGGICMTLLVMTMFLGAWETVATGTGTGA